jgi:hypothetical protein
MLTSPIEVTIDSVAHSLSRVNQDNYGSIYLKKGDGFEIRMAIRHSYEKAGVSGQYERHNVDLTYTAFDEEGTPTSTQAYGVLRTKRGTDGAMLVDVSNALNGFIDANTAEIVAWES